jgi:hypothetical protein
MELDAKKLLLKEAIVRMEPDEAVEFLADVQVGLYEQEGLIKKENLLIVELEKWRQLTKFQRFIRTTLWLTGKIFFGILGIPFAGIVMLFTGMGFMLGGGLVLGACLWVVKMIILYLGYEPSVIGEEIAEWLKSF